MTDLEMTRLCAEAMGLKLIAGRLTADGEVFFWSTDSAGAAYDPLHDDAQLFALARQFPFEFESAVIEWCNHLRRKDSFNLSNYFCERVAKRGL